MLRNWFWKVEEARGGPDYVLVLRFEPDDAARLPELVRAFPLPGFVLGDIGFDFGEPNRKGTPGLQYVDAGSSKILAEQHASGQRQNIWIYHSISIEGHVLSIERGGGGHAGGECDRSETSLAAMLASSSEVALASWDVWQWGYGSGDQALADGHNGPQLLEYLSLS